MVVSLVNPVLSRQVFVPQQKLLVHRTRYVGQKARPSAVPHADLSYSAAKGLNIFTIRAMDQFGNCVSCSDYFYSRDSEYTRQSAHSTYARELIDSAHPEEKRTGEKAWRRSLALTTAGRSFLSPRFRFGADTYVRTPHTCSELSRCQVSLRRPLESEVFAICRADRHWLPCRRSTGILGVRAGFRNNRFPQLDGR